MAMNNSKSLIRRWIRKAFDSVPSLNNSTSISAIGSSFSHQAPHSRNYVIFRFDDIPYDVPENEYNLIDAELAIMDLFIEKNQKLSLALVASYVNESQSVIKKIEEGLNLDLFELAIHGWEHTDFALMSEIQQHKFLFDALNKIEHIFGRCPQVFIPPYNSFNEHTLQAMKRLGISVLSSELDLDENEAFNMKHTQDQSPGKRTEEEKQDPLDDKVINSIYHIPQMTGYDTFKRSRLFKVPIKRILKEIDSNISRYGYAVITIHPQSIIKCIDGKYTNEIDTREITNVENLIEVVRSKNMELSTFSHLLYQASSSN